MLNMLTLFQDLLQDHVQSVTINKCIASIIDLDPDHILKTTMKCTAVLFLSLM